MNATLEPERRERERAARNYTQQYASFAIAKAVGCRITGLLACQERLCVWGIEDRERRPAGRPRVRE